MLEIVDPIGIMITDKKSPYYREYRALFLKKEKGIKLYDILVIDGKPYEILEIRELAGERVAIDVISSEKYRGYISSKLEKFVDDVDKESAADKHVRNTVEELMGFSKDEKRDKNKF